MDRQAFSTCIGQGMSGKKFTKDERKLEFCVLAKLCSKKAGSREEAIAICKQPKPPKPPRPEGEKKQRRSKQQECPEFDPMELMPHCEAKLEGLIHSGELPANADVNGFCRLILG